MRDVMRVVTDTDGVRVELKAERQSEAFTSVQCRAIQTTTFNFCRAIAW